jgi:hypothetical protein
LKNLKWCKLLTVMRHSDESYTFKQLFRCFGRDGTVVNVTEAVRALEHVS